MRKIVLGSFFGMAFLSPVFGQISVTNTQAPDALVQGVLLGNGVTATNITYNGSAVGAQQIQTNVTYFDATNTSFPIQRGVLLTTGQGIAAIGPNNSTSYTLGGTPMVTADADLNAIAAGSVTNGAILEFDFTPTGDTVSFKYVFGSDEYPEFSPSTFNDAFGFFLSGPGFAGPYTNGAENIALVPGTAIPVTINNVGDQSNTQYYVANDNGLAYGTAIQYDGTTVVLTAVAQVQCGQTYHIKLAICNVGDQSYDSGVFLEAESFASDVVDISVATVSGDTTVVEGCTDAQFIFTRPVTQAGDTLTVSYTIGGTAIMGTDYNNMTNPVVFLPGEDTVVLTLTPVQDGINDSPETVIFTATTITECGDTIISQGVLYILDGPNLVINETNPLVQCATDSVLMSAFASGGYPPYTYAWSYMGQTGDTAYAPIYQNGTVDVYVTATDGCGFTGVDTVTITMNQTLAIDTLIPYPATACNPDGAVSAFVIGITGQPLYSWTGPGNPGPNNIDATVMQNIPSGWYYFTVSDAVCSVNDSVFVTQEQSPVAQFSADVMAGCDPLTVTFTNTSQNATNYVWSFGNGNNANVNDLSSQTQTYNNSTTVQLIALQGQCADTMTLPIVVSVCGCTDPTALNYNPLATVDDNSCVYPIPPLPTVEVPNVFTPNDDTDNPVFVLTTTNATDIELTIVNRWGNTVYTGKGINPAWDGKVNSTDAAEGVYFYKYIVTGIGGDKLEGHGFLQLIRD
ncbi:MAG: choice-of-anchor L domain-containing protein [Bacteroidota bacterium]